MAADPIFSEMFRLIALPRIVLLIWRSYLKYREHKVVSKQLPIPKYLKDTTNDEDFQKSRLYKEDNLKFAFLDDLTSTFFEILFIMKHASSYWMDSILIGRKLFYPMQSLAIPAIIFTIKSTLWNLPHETLKSSLKTFYLEEKHGFNNQTVKFFVKDQLKSIALNLVIGSLFSSILVKSLEITEPHFIITTLCVSVIAGLLLMILLPNYILPLFDQFRDLQSSDFRTSIHELAKKYKFPVSDIKIQKSSMRSHHSNAYFVGLLTKKIVMFETLLYQQIEDNPEWKYDLHEKKSDNPSSEEISDENESSKSKVKYSDDEVLAILSHEIGHWYHKHIMLMIGFNLISATLCLLISSSLISSNILVRLFRIPSLYSLKVIFTISYVLGPIFELVTYAFLFLSRRNEYQADRFAVNDGRGQALITGLKKIFLQNKSYPYNDPLYSMFTHSHPTSEHRIAALEASNSPMISKNHKID